MYWRVRATVFVLCSLVLSSPELAHSQTRPTPRPGEIIIYQNRNFSGSAVSVSRDRPNLGLAWPVRSLRVRGGVWQACERPNYRGRCFRFSVSERSTALRIQSIRPIGGGIGPGPGGGGTAPGLAGWSLLGEREVSELIDRDIIEVRSRRLYNAMRLCVYRSRVRIYDLTVRFTNGRTQSIPIRDYVNDGQCSRNFQVAGGRLSIASVQLTYEAASLGFRRATVRLFAR